MKRNLGTRIRELRELKDLSLREFAKKLQTSAAHISDIELGRRFPSDDLLTRIASLLGETVSDLKEYDYRAPTQDLKRLSEANPAYGFAFRKVIETEMTPEEILEMLKKREEESS